MTDKNSKQSLLVQASLESTFTNKKSGACVCVFLGCSSGDFYIRVTCGWLSLCLSWEIFFLCWLHSRDKKSEKHK